MIFSSDGLFVHADKYLALWFSAVLFFTGLNSFSEPLGKFFKRQSQTSVEIIANMLVGLIFMAVGIIALFIFVGVSHDPT